MHKKGHWSFNSINGILAGGKQEQTYLEPRLASLFLILFENHDRIVSRRALSDQMWPDTIVNEDSLTRAVSKLGICFLVLHINWYFRNGRSSAHTHSKNFFLRCYWFNSYHDRCLDYPPDARSHRSNNPAKCLYAAVGY